MKTIPTKPPKDQLARLWWKDARQLVILLMLASTGQPLTAAEISRQTGSAHETISTKLRSLARSGLVARPHVRGGWYLTRQGWQIMRPANDPPYRLADCHASGGGTQATMERVREPAGRVQLAQTDLAVAPMEMGMEPVGQAQDDRADTAMEMGAEPAGLAQPVQDDLADSRMEMGMKPAGQVQPAQDDSADLTMNNCPHVADPHAFLAEKRVKTLKEEVKSIKDSSSSVLTDSEAENRVFMRQLLEGSYLLFGPPGVLLNGLPPRPPEMVLGWLAQAYARRNALRSPAALVYSQLRLGHRPPRIYQEHPERYLPRDFLEAVGLLPAASAEAEKEFPPQEEQDPPAQAAPDPSLLVEVNGRTALQAWEQAVDLLRAEMSPASYQAYLAPARGRRWEPPGRLVVATADEPARAWLESRVKRTLERMLVGILNQQVEVVFETLGEDNFTPPQVYS